MTDWSLYVGWFMRRRMVPAPARERVDVADVYRGFLAWWRDATWWDEALAEAPGPLEFSAALAKLSSANRGRLRVEVAAGRAYCCGVRLAG